MNLEVVGLGALNIDHIYKVERILADVEAVVNSPISSPGGSAANTIYGLARLRVPSGFVGVVGDDAEGEMMLRDFQKVGVDTSHVRAKRGTRTGSVLCLSDREGRRSLYVMPGANNRLTVDDLDMTYVNQAKILHLSSFAGSKQFKVLRELTERLGTQVKVSFAPGALYAAKGLKALAPILARAHLLFINGDEIGWLTGKDYKAGAETCLRQGCRIVVVTLGKGTKPEPGEDTAVCYIRDADGEYFVTGSQDPVPEVDTTGAGDAFAAGFLYGYLDSKGLAECGWLGNIVAQSSITRIGARAGLPTAAQLSELYRELYPK